jgi:hypothetical protein
MNVHKNARLTPLVESGLYGRSRAGRRRRPSPKPQASARGRFASGSIVMGAKDRRDCRIAHHGRTGCVGQLLRRLSTRSKSCAANAGSASRSRRRQAYHQRPSAGFCVGSA